MKKMIRTPEQKTIRGRHIAIASALLGYLMTWTTHVSAAPGVSGSVISWPDDGWYQVQNANTFESVCQGGTSCEVAAGSYIVINHTTGMRFEDITVAAGNTGSGSNTTGVSVMGNTISWPDDGWYQVQVAGDFNSSLCSGASSCEVAPGTYVVINHTTGMRFENIVVQGGNGGSATVGNIVETAVAAGGFNTLVAALQATGLDKVLADETATFTVFAPSDEAFAALGSDTINSLLGDTDTLSDILLYHVIGGAAVDAETAISLTGSSVTTANGDDVNLSLRNGSLFINDSQVIVADIMTSNGIIHVIDMVLTPPADDTQSGSGGGTDNGSGNGGQQSPAAATILQLAEGADDFSILTAALKATGLDGALGHPADNYTVFAPTNAAFEALGQDTINALLADPDALRNILLLHVLPGTVFDAAAFGNILGFDIGAGNGGTLNVTATDNGLAVNGVDIIAADIMTGNGIVHVIDQVLIPPAQ